MKFIIRPEIFEKIPDMYVGVVVADGIDNSINYVEINELLQKYNNLAKEKFAGANVKERPEIVPYREAFRKIDINPNRYPCSAEALFRRISKGKDLPKINPLVDLNNAISLKYSVPMGTHNLDGSKKNIEMRLSQKDDHFIPLGKDKIEKPDENEVIYAVGNDVRTRRWTWRQSESGKITPETHSVFFPIDGFKGVNQEVVDQARDDLAQKLESIFHVKVQTGYVDMESSVFEWNF